MGQSTLTPEQLARALIALDLGQEDFARILLVRRASVSRWLSGRVPVPGYVESWLRDAHPEVYEGIKREG